MLERNMVFESKPLPALFWRLPYFAAFVVLCLTLTASAQTVKADIIVSFGTSDPDPFIALSSGYVDVFVRSDVIGGQPCHFFSCNTIWNERERHPYPHTHCNLFHAGCDHLSHHDSLSQLSTSRVTRRQFNIVLPLDGLYLDWMDPANDMPMSKYMSEFEMPSSN